MTTQTKKTYVYEGMFLFPQTVLGNLQEAVDHLRQVLDRAEAEIISMRKWDDRKLAYEIKGNKRGVFFLVYFRAPGEKMDGLDRDCNLSEMMLRAMVLRADHLTQEQIEAVEGRTELEDEIRLRREQQVGEGESAATAVVMSRSQRQAQMAVSGDENDSDNLNDDESEARLSAVAGAQDDDSV